MILSIQIIVTIQNNLSGGRNDLYANWINRWISWCSNDAISFLKLRACPIHKGEFDTRSDQRCFELQEEGKKSKQQQL